MQEKIRVAEENESLRVRILGEIDHHCITELRSQIDSRLFNVRPRILVLDFSSVSFMDSSGIGLIMGRVEKAKSLGTKVSLVGLSKTVYKLVSLAGLLKIDGLTVNCGRETK
jgi:stage II sporulation protein AA (anti-sigma F factor antagonist)